MIRKRQHLSADTLGLIFNCIDIEDTHLEKLHWSILPFLPKENNHKGANALDTLSAIRLRRHKLEQARKELGAVFETQFSIAHHAKCSGMSVYEYRKRLKETEEQYPLGNSRPMFVKRKTSKKGSSSGI